MLGNHSERQAMIVLRGTLEYNPALRSWWFIDEHGATRLENIQNCPTMNGLNLDKENPNPADLMLKIRRP